MNEYNVAVTMKGFAAQPVGTIEAESREAALNRLEAAVDEQDKVYDFGGKRKTCIGDNGLATSDSQVADFVILLKDEDGGPIDVDED